MYTPSHYKIEDPQAVYSFIKQYSFGTMISFTDSFHVTHLPFVLVGIEPLSVSSHMARANPHWKCFANKPEVLIIFQGPHAYISPALYEEKVSVPTWNYAVVHAYGKAKVIDDLEAALEKMISLDTHRFTNSGGRLFRWHVLINERALLPCTCVISLEHIQYARQRISAFVKRTPLDRNEYLGAKLGTNLYLKYEVFQRTGSFKVRGAFNKLLSLAGAERG